MYIERYNTLSLQQLMLLLEEFILGVDRFSERI